MAENRFVFVVCGSREHIDTLHFSLRYLKHFSSKKIIVLTDSTRNEIAVEHDNVVDVRAPENFSHHQASIYLKTGLHKFLNSGHNYCYLDTDVVAVSNKCDDIFLHYKTPITFARDHTTMRSFSPYAVNCNCLTENKNYIEKLRLAESEFNKEMQPIKDEVKPKVNALDKKLKNIKKNLLRYSLLSLRFNLSRKVFKLDEDTFYDKRKKLWFDANGDVLQYNILEDQYVAFIEKTSGLRRDKKAGQWITPEGWHVFDCKCDHLKNKIQQKFNIKIGDADFPHWNGGVFLFDDESKNFLDAWHSKTMEIFKDPEWKTRDQGTLIATAWEFGLEKHYTLPKQFNFIADYYNQKMSFDKKAGLISDDGFATSYAPVFLHIFHHFGTKGWDVWDWVEERLPHRTPF